MEKQYEEKTQKTMKTFGKIRRQQIDVSPASMVKTNCLNPGQKLPLVIQPGVDHVDLGDWARANRVFLESSLNKHGAVLFRDFSLNTVEDFEKTALALCPELYGEYGDLPREGVSNKIYASTPYPANQSILFHNESSHLPRWPLKQFFFCVQTAREGGETPLLDCHQVWQNLDQDVLRPFAEKGLMYVRNFSSGIDVNWQQFFHTEEKAVVEDLCKKEGMCCEWTAGGNLRIRQAAKAVVKHPKTGVNVFFNQIQLHHPFCLQPEVRQSLRSLFAEEDLPRNVFYGDGTVIEDDVMEELGKLFSKISVSFPWKNGDLIMVDNMLVAHARNPYVGPRKIVVAMGEMFHGICL